MTSGLAWNKGLMLLNRLIYYGIVYPQVSEISKRNRMQAFKCAKAVIAYISMVFRWSSGWSRMPGVSIICHLEYLYSV